MQPINIKRPCDHLVNILEKGIRNVIETLQNDTPKFQPEAHWYKKNSYHKILNKDCFHL